MRGPLNRGPLRLPMTKRPEPRGEAWQRVLADAGFQADERAWSPDSPLRSCRVSSHDFSLQTFKLSVSDPRAIAYLHSNMPFESSSLPGAGPIFPDLPFELALHHQVSLLWYWSDQHSEIRSVSRKSTPSLEDSPPTFLYTTQSASFDTDDSAWSPRVAWPQIITPSPQYTNCLTVRDVGGTGILASTGTLASKSGLKRWRRWRRTLEVLFYVIRGNHFSNTTCLTHVFFKGGK